MTDRLPISDLPIMAEEEATGDVARIFDEIRRDTEAPFVANIFRAPASSPQILEGVWEAYRRIQLQATLPASLVGMINFAVSAANNCNYCNSLHTIACKMIGIDDETLTALNDDLESLAPQRVQEIIRFAVKAGTEPQTLTADDYQRVRDQGVGDEEIVEIVALAAWATFADRLADGLKVDLDEPFKQALAG